MRSSSRVILNAVKPFQNAQDKLREESRGKSTGSGTGSFIAPPVGGAMKDDTFDVSRIEKDFPIFANRTNGKPFVYLDSAATSQKPQVVIDAVTDFYTNHNANVHRGMYALSEEATALYEGARKKVAEFIRSRPLEIVFTGNASEAINLVAFGWGRKFLKKGDVVVLSEMEHHSNIVPWQQLVKERGIKLHFLPITETYELDYKSLVTTNIGPVRLISLTHASNVLGTINPIAEIISFYKKQGITAKFLVDAAQSIPHMPVSVQDLGCDFLVFSGHKMLGPTGIGVLWSKQEILEEMDPLLYGSHMIRKVTKTGATWNDIPWKFELGTGKLEAAVGLGAAVDYLSNLGMENVQQHDQTLVQYVLSVLSNIQGIQIYGPSTQTNRLATFSFNLKGVHAHDVAQILDRYSICVRSGHHCAQPLMDVLGVPATVRASCYLYNTTEDIDQLVIGLKQVRRVMKI